MGYKKSQKPLRQATRINRQGLTNLGRSRLLPDHFAHMLACQPLLAEESSMTRSRMVRRVARERRREVEAMNDEGGRKGRDGVGGEGWVRVREGKG